jgi:hypothetical protein
MNTTATPSTARRAARIPRTRRMPVILGRVAIPAAFAAATLAALTGCSSLSTPSASPAPAASAASASPSTAPSTATTPSAAPATPPAATPAPAATPTPVQTSSGTTTTTTSTAGQLAAQVDILGTPTGLVPGGSWVKFLVTVTNGTSQTYSNVMPLVSLGHCSCTANSLFPAGKLQERDSTSNEWQTLPYDVEGFGTDYLNAMDPGGIQELSPGAAAVFEYRVKLSPATSAQITRGAGSLDVTLIQLPSHAQIGASPAGSTPVDVQSGQPPA